VQKSIRDSVKRLLDDQIALLGLTSFFESTDAEIRGKNGSLFVFSGLSNHTVDSIKSFEGVDRCWVEEAHGVSSRSWQVLTPTIRKPNSEIWISFNPELDTDPVWVRYVENPPDDCISVEVNYSDNPWFPEVLEKERLHCLESNPEDYEWIWEGKCKPAVDGAIYATEIGKAQSSGQICNVPYDPLLKVHAVFDLGWNDSMAIILVQKVRSELRVIEYIEDDHKTLDYYSSMLRNKNLNWGKLFLPHDGGTRDFKTGKSSQEIMQKMGWSVEIVPQIGLENGIKAARMAFGQVYFNKASTDRLINCLKRYRRQINAQTMEPGAPLHDEYSHGADVFRYMCVAADSMSNEQWAPINYGKSGIV
jgi:phage terminase large subunit